MADTQIFVVGVVQTITLNTGYRNGRHLVSHFCAAYNKRRGCMKTRTIFRRRANDVWYADTINIWIKITQSYLWQTGPWSTWPANTT